MDIDETLKSFRSDLKHLEVTPMIRKHLVFGSCFLYPRKDDYYALAETVADHFKIHPTCVFVVGSAKLGFSVAPQKRYRAFCDTSDIDLVIVSETLFDRIWKEFYSAKIDDVDWKRKGKFLEYLFQGWLRPDKFPEVKTGIADDWWEFFAELSRGQPAKVAGALYRDWNFFEGYQAKCIKACMEFESGAIT